MARNKRLLCLAAFSACLVGRTTAICYDQNGNELGFNGEPCDPSAAVSACCGPGDICYTNGLCQPSPELNKTFVTTYFADGCTDETYDGPECAAFNICKNVTGNGVQSCLNNQYCCFGFQGCDCSDTQSLFTLPVGEIITTLALFTSSTTTSSTSTSTSSSAPTSTTSSLSTFSSSPSATRSTPKTSSTPTPTAPPASSTPQPASSTGHQLVLGVGVGVGIGIPLIALFIALCYYWQRRRKRRIDRAKKYIAAYPESSTLQRSDSKRTQKYAGRSHRAELDSCAISETYGLQRHAELE